MTAECNRVVQNVQLSRLLALLHTYTRAKALQSAQFCTFARSPIARSKNRFSKVTAHLNGCAAGPFDEAVESFACPLGRVVARFLRCQS